MASPLRSVHAGLGAVFREEHGVEVVAHFGDSRAGALGLLEAAGVADLSHRGWLQVTGRDRIRFLQAMATNDVAGCGPGQGLYTLFLNDKGRVVSDANVFVAPEAVYLDVEAPARTRLPEMLERFIIMDDVVLTDITESRVLLGVHGPLAHEVVSSALGSELPELDEHTHHRVGSVLVWRHDRTGVPGYELTVTPEAAPVLLDELQQSGALPVGLDALEIVRIERGVPRAFAELDETTVALEAGGERAISRAKGCYLGQEVIVRAQDRGGVKRRLSGLRVRGLNAPGRGAPISLGDKEVGLVTSACMGASVPGPIALSILKREAWEPGTEVLVAGVPSVVSPLPFPHPPVLP